MDSLEIKVMATGSPEDITHIDTTSAFIARVMEEALTREMEMDATAVSPSTGEPIYLAANATAVQHIDCVTVSSPHAIFSALVKAMEDLEAESALEAEQFPPDIVLFYDGDDLYDWTPSS